MLQTIIANVIQSLVVDWIKSQIKSLNRKEEYGNPVYRRGSIIDYRA